MKKRGMNLLWMTILCAFVASVMSCQSGLGEADSPGADNYDADAGADGDMDADMDTDTGMDADSDGDSDGEDDFPPEDEQSANYMAPQGSGRYVFIADENNDSVVVVDSETLDIQVVEVGARPTQVVPLGEDSGRVAVINLDSDEVTLLQVDSTGEVAMENLPVRPDTNAVAPSPDGRYVIAFHDPMFTVESGAPSTDQEISVLTTTPGQEGSVPMSVGIHPWQVIYNDDATRAYVVSEAGIDIIDLSDLGAEDNPSIVSPFESGTYDSKTADIEITPDGSLALARKTESSDLVAVSLDVNQGEKRVYSLQAVPTDLDIASDGSFGVLVLRSLNQVAVFNLPLPEDPQTDPFTYIDLGEKVVGIATLTPDGNHMLLHTTTAGDEEDKQRLTLLSFENDAWETNSVVLEREIRAVVAGVDSKTAIVVHQPINAYEDELPYSYSLVDLPNLKYKFQQILVEPGQLLLTPDGEFGFLLLETATSTDIINLTNFIVDPQKLGSPPTAAGYAAETDKVFIAQDHPAGRMTFIGVHDGSVKTVTGYYLNDEIE
jgi:YVTN family beta-propeller protein